MVKRHDGATYLFAVGMRPATTIDGNVPRHSLTRAVRAGTFDPRIEASSSAKLMTS